MTYVLIMCGAPDHHKPPYLVFPKSRVFEYTSDHLVERYKDADGTISDEITDLPAILAYESFNQTDAQRVKIKQVRQRGSEVRFEVEPQDGHTSIPWSVLEDKSWDLDIEPFEFNRVHVAIKESNLEAVDFGSIVTVIAPPVNTATTTDQSKPEDVSTASVNKQKLKIFVCYSHADTDQLNRLLIHLKPLKQAFDIEAWSDTQLQASIDWRSEIEGKLSDATAAVLLVSADFLASDFINDVELPAILEGRRSRGLPVYPVIVKPCLFSRHPDLSRIQAINSPSETIADMSVAHAERVWMRLAETIWRMNGSEP